MLFFSKYNYIFCYSFIKSDLITPRMIPDDIDLFDLGGKNALNLGQSDKPWLAYIDSNLNKSISECLKYKIHFSTNLEMLCIINQVINYSEKSLIQHVLYSMV